MWLIIKIQMRLSLLYLLLTGLLLIFTNGCKKEEYKPPVTPPGPLFVFGFTDGYEADYHHAYRELKLRGVRGTSFLNTATIGTPEKLTWDMIREMVNDGWEMGCKTHNHLELSEATAQEIRHEMEMVNSLYTEQGLAIPKHITYPNGAYTSYVGSVVSEYRISGRRFTGLSNNFTNKGFNFMSYGWVHADMQDEEGVNGLNNAKAKVDLAFQEQSVIVSFLIHNIVESLSSPPVPYECLLVNFQQLLDYITAKGGKIMTTNEAFEIISEYRRSANIR
jgi:peptidoglycan/xylan/chitin deacetylase (PgdA/CDA1 family)